MTAIRQFLTLALLLGPLALHAQTPPLPTAAAASAASAAAPAKPAVEPPAATAHRHTADGKTTSARGAATERDDGMADGVIEGQSI